MTNDALPRPRRSKALPLGITALVLLLLPWLMLPVLFAFADPFLAVLLFGPLYVVSAGLGITAVIIGVRSRNATTPLRSANAGAIIGGIAVVFAVVQAVRVIGFFDLIAAGS